MIGAYVRILTKAGDGEKIFFNGNLDYGHKRVSTTDSAP